jgi:Tol biopolymer transport system component
MRRVAPITVTLVGLALVSLAGVGSGTGLAAESIVPIVWSTDGEIGRVNPDGSGRSVIIAPPDSTHRFFTPDLAPDGSQLVFVDCDPANHHPGSACILAAANVDGSGYRPLGGHRSPRWSPDGKRIAAIRYESDGRVHIVTVMDADGSNRRDLAYVESDSLDWSADGRSIVFGDSKNPEDATAVSALFSLPADGSGSRKQLGPDGSYEHPTWSPDGTQIALIRHFSRTGQDLSAVAVMNGDGTGLRDVSSPTPRWPGLGRPAWSPDSRSLAFATKVSRSDGNLDTPLDLYDLGDGSVTRVMDNGGGGVSWGNPSGPPSCGSGYWMVGSDGGVFSFGRARFAGSAQPLRLRKPVVGMAAIPTGNGYWLVASDGGIFAFDVPFYGSMGSTPLNKPVSGMVPGPGGYLMVAEDGGIFAFGNVRFHGSLGKTPPASPVVAVALLG